MDSAQLQYTARDAAKNRHQLFQKEKRANFGSVDRKGRLMRSGISTMAQPNNAGMNLTPRGPLRAHTPQQKQTDMGISANTNDILSCIEPPRGDAAGALHGALTHSAQECHDTTQPAASTSHDGTLDPTSPHGKSCTSTEAGHGSAPPHYKSLRGRLLVATGPGCLAPEEHEMCTLVQPQTQKKRWQGNSAAKESHLNQIFSNYSSRSDRLEDAVQVRGLLKEIFATFDAAAEKKSKVASIVGQLELPISRPQLVSIVSVTLWSANRPQSGSASSSPWKKAQLAFIEAQMEKVGMLDAKPSGGSGATSRATSRGGSKANSRSGSQYGSRIASRIASRTGSVAVSQSGTPRARSISFRRAGSRGRDLSSGSARGNGDAEGQHVRNLKMLPAEKILMKGKMHRPISPNRSPKSAANKGHSVSTAETAPCPFPTVAREAMDVDDVLHMVSKRLVSDTSPETA